MRWLPAIVIIAVPAALSAQKKVRPLSAAESAAYAQFRERVLDGDTTADYTKLRLLYARITDEGKPSPSAAFERARAAGDSMSARAILDTLLFAYVGHVRAQRDVGRVYAARGDSTRARRQAAVVRAFVRSIASTDGLTPETGMLVTSIAEEYAVMEARGVTRDIAQAFITGERTSRGNEAFDVLSGTDSTGKTVSLYFRLNWY